MFPVNLSDQLFLRVTLGNSNHAFDLLACRFNFSVASGFPGRTPFGNRLDLRFLHSLPLEHCTAVLSVALVDHFRMSHALRETCEVGLLLWFRAFVLDHQIRQVVLVHSSCRQFQLCSRPIPRPFMYA